MFKQSAKNREMNVTRNKFSQKNAIVLACSQFLRGTFAVHEQFLELVSAFWNQQLPARQVI